MSGRRLLLPLASALDGTATSLPPHHLVGVGESQFLLYFVRMIEPIIVVGGGFGGIYTTKHLLNAGLPVLLISEHNFFTFTPLLHEVATGSLTTSDVTFENSSFFRSKRFRFVRGTVDNIDLKQHKVYIGETSFEFQSLVIATGSTTHYYNISGTEHCLPLKTIEDALQIKRRVLELAQNADHDVRINVIGAGPTGVELVLEINDLLHSLQKRNTDLSYHLRLINAGDSILAPFTKSVQSFAQRVLENAGIEIVHKAIAKEFTASKIITTAGNFDTNLTIMAAGVTPQTQCVDQEHVDEREHIHVNEHLQVRGYENIFALGDIIVMNGQPIPKLAQTAVQEAKVVAQNIMRLQKKQPLVSCSLKLKGSLVSLGAKQGAGTIFGMTVKGLFAWWLWRTVYLLKTPGLTNKLRVAFSWTLNLFTGRDLSER